LNFLFVFCSSIFTDSLATGFGLFESLLLNHLPALASPEYKPGFAKGKAPWLSPFPQPRSMELITRYNIDAGCNAIHRDAADVLLPYKLQWDATCWWHSQLVLLHHAQVLYPTNKGYLWGVAVDNTASSDYPRRANFSGVTADWMSRFLPQELYKCVSGEPARGMPSLTQPSNRPARVRFDGRTFFNIKPCDEFD
jgi:hypothetical protein